MWEHGYPCCFPKAVMETQREAEKLSQGYRARLPERKQFGNLDSFDAKAVMSTA